MGFFQFVLGRGLMYAFEVRAENEHGLSEPIIARFNIPDGSKRYLILGHFKIYNTLTQHSTIQR